MRLEVLARGEGDREELVAMQWPVDGAPPLPVGSGQLGVVADGEHADGSVDVTVVTGFVVEG
ncbi:hypothetical protein ACQUSR_00600 [Streptomyces sp. P1-3]|uniref:hypothetical protein n=1 Tax=Streptomyces sp. P1-3 TaxID=3421658 RepID=UPI003D35AA18